MTDKINAAPQVREHDENPESLRLDARNGAGPAGAAPNEQQAVWDMLLLDGNCSDPALTGPAKLRRILDDLIEARRPATRDPQPLRAPGEVKQRVVCAALRHESGLIVCGPRHLDLIMHRQINASNCDYAWKTAEQGFVDQRGNFLTRKQALAVAEEAGQIIRRSGGDDEELFSENLY